MTTQNKRNIAATVLFISINFFFLMLVLGAGEVFGWWIGFLGVPIIVTVNAAFFLDYYNTKYQKEIRDKWMS